MKSLTSLWVLLGILAGGITSLSASDITLEAQLVWGTNDKASPNPKHKKVDTILAEQLGKQFKWTNYFEVKRVLETVPHGQAKRIRMSEDCEIEVHNLSGNQVKVVLYGKKKEVLRREGSLTKTDWLIIGGDVSNDSSAWFVVFRMVDPPEKKK